MEEIESGSCVSVHPSLPLVPSILVAFILRVPRLVRASGVTLAAGLAASVAHLFLVAFRVKLSDL